MIRYATINDIQNLVDIELAALPDDFLPRIGKKFLSELFFPVVLQSTQAFTLVNTEEGVVNAFVIFTYESKALTAELMKQKLLLAKFLLVGFFRDFTLFFDIVAILRGFRVEINQDFDINIEELPELYLIATAPKIQSKGIGMKIVNKGLEILHEKSFHQTIVKTSSERAREFYLKQHYIEIGLEYRQKRKLYLLLYDLDSMKSQS